MSLKDIRDHFSQICDLRSGKGKRERRKEKEGLNFLVGKYPTEEGNFQDFMYEWGWSPSLLPLMRNNDPHKKNSEEFARSDNCNDFEKTEREYFLLKQQIYSM